MAITILDQPTALSLRPAFAPIEYLLSSTNTGEDGFKIVCGIRFNSANVALLTLDSIPNTEKILVTAQNIMKSFNTSVYSILSGDLPDIQQISLPSFFLDFREYYDGALQGSTVLSASINTYYSSPKYTEFASEAYLKRQLNNLTVGLDPSTFGLFLSGFENYQTVANVFNGLSRWQIIKPSQKIQAGFLLSTNDNNFEVYLQTFDASNTFINANRLTFDKNKGHYTLDIGFEQLPEHDWASPLVLTNVKKYSITILDKDNQDEPVSFTYLFELDECKQYEPYEIHWLNRHGGYDSFVFSGKSKHETSNTKTMAKAKPNRINGNNLQYLTSSIESRPFHVSTQDMFNLSSRIIRDFEVEGFEDMFSSPEVYWNSPDGFINVNIKGTVYEHKTTENGQVFNIEAQFDIASNERQW